MCDYAHAPLDQETITLSSFTSGDKLNAFIPGVYGLKGLQNLMSSFFQKLIDQGCAVVRIDEILLLANTNTRMIEHFEQLNQF